MDGGVVDLIDLIAGDEVRAKLVAIRVVELDLVRGGIPVETLESYLQQVLAVDGLRVRCHLLNPRLLEAIA